MQELRIGVIGAGGRGGLARHAHHPDAGSRLVAFCDLDPQVLAKCREEYGQDVFTTSDYRELLNQELEAVFVTTPDYLHETQATAALESGKAVYLEKPMAITIDGCDRILAAAARTGNKLYMGHNMRHMPFVLKMKELIDGGAIGEVKAVWCRHFVGHGGDFYFKDWHSERAFTTGMLLQKACHDIDVIHWLSGGYAHLVNALGALTVYDQVENRRAADEKGIPRINLNHWPPLAQTGLSPVIDVEDLSLVNMRLDNGVHVAYQQCHYTPDYWRNYTFIGAEGRIENFGDGEPGTVIKLWNRRSYGYNGEAGQVFPVDVETGDHGGADTRIVGEFLGYVRGLQNPSTSCIAARNSVAAGCAATESLRSGGQPVEIPPVDAELITYFGG
ncbi:MAG: Gfo/Idh/MocA family oxidoreductase [Anaerolineae bacterium]|nr:Gfo/Idh/MocA family oxidoreductase [Anaerolineae bacterium]